MKLKSPITKKKKNNWIFESISLRERVKVNENVKDKTEFSKMTNKSVV